MDILFLIILVAIFIVPTFLMSRRQRARMSEIQKLQDALVPGDRVVTTAGLHCTVVSSTEDTVDLEVAPGVISTYEKISVVRVLQKTNAPQVIDEPTEFEQRDPEGPVDGYTDGHTDGHPENR
ncbi:hypothetical protein CDES_08285 [Corynebacterium deserti GIMN1.010]|uniref:Preprotein translocase subunit YajC n=1 Tax=Corynebacterium deserti GIMN1.010 TaxID=931089 RepID=A0A0M4CXN4_9CORY|nr:preprotein translocase subunit YajC [Corynebacterium deserti]ALC06062.1 hypothetical protein CDES_08285 [Corynebacterium deserti GIMN1.010]